MNPSTQRTQRFHAKNAKPFRLPAACMLIAGMACAGCHPALPRNTSQASAAEPEECPARSIAPLPNDLKKNVAGSMPLPEIERMLGPSHETFGSGIAYCVWYFDDHTCLVVPSLEGEPYIWLACDPGGFTIELLKRERMKAPAQ